MLTLPAPAITKLMKFREAGNHPVFPSLADPHKPFEFRPFWDIALADAKIEDFRF